MRTPFCFTSSGKVAWAQKSAGDYVLLTLQDAPQALHAYWLLFTAIVLLGLLLVRWRTRQPLWPISNAKILIALCGLTLLYIAGAGLFAAKAGMFNPRYYIFILPFVAVAMGTVFAQLHQRWSIAGAAVVIVALAVPAIHTLQSRQNQDFRAMTLFAVRGSDAIDPLSVPMGSEQEYLSCLSGEISAWCGPALAHGWNLVAGRSGAGLRASP